MPRSYAQVILVFSAPIVLMDQEVVWQSYAEMFLNRTRFIFSKYTSFENCSIQISSCPQIYHILAIYLPPQTTNAVCQAEFGSFIEKKHALEILLLFFRAT